MKLQKPEVPMKPNINVTPLIDVLLVLLIIFMVVAPARPARFEAKLPTEPKNMNDVVQNPNTIIVAVRADGSVDFNDQKNVSDVSNFDGLIGLLRDRFEYRATNGILRPGSNEIERTVFISAPRSMDYGTVVKVVDAVKLAGADPIGLQLDDLH